MLSITELTDNFAFTEALLNKQVSAKKETGLIIREYVDAKKEDYKQEREISVPPGTTCTVLSEGSLKRDYSTGMIRLGCDAVLLKPNEELVIQTHYTKMKEVFEDHFVPVSQN